MEKKIYITVYSAHTEVEPSGEIGEPDTMEMSVEGILTLENGKYEIKYEESDLTGMEGSETSISFYAGEPELITLTRYGNVETAMTFEAGKRHTSVYSTEAFSFEVCIKTNRVKNCISENGGIMELDYGLEFRGLTTQNTYMKITVRTVK